MLSSEYDSKILIRCAERDTPDSLFDRQACCSTRTLMPRNVHIKMALISCVHLSQWPADKKWVQPPSKLTKLSWAPGSRFPPYDSAMSTNLIYQCQKVPTSDIRSVQHGGPTSKTKAGFAVWGYNSRLRVANTRNVLTCKFSCEIYTKFRFFWVFGPPSGFICV